MKADMERRMNEEYKQIELYVKNNNITVQPTVNGLYYIETLKGKGIQPDSGKTVSVNYTGKFLDGKVFDASEKMGKAFEFELGKGMVIPAWEEGIAKMKAGGKATFLVPSRIAYGPRGAGKAIPPFTPLVFDVELVAVK